MVPLTVPLAKPKVVRNIAICIGFLLIALWAFSDENYFVAIVPLYFVMPLVFHIHRLLSNRREALLINHEGLTDFTPGLGVGFIPWSEIEDVELRKEGISSFLNIRVRNESALLARLNPLKRFNAWLSKSLGYGPILISLSATDVDPLDVIFKIREARAAL